MIDVEAVIDLPAHITSKGEVFIGGQELPYLVAAEGIKAERIKNGRNHLLTLTLIVGDVTMEQKAPEEFS